ncbi:Hypothetical protein POVR1_LOCUS219 [uncultured virus]|nr:Hypothetical protein POVR1_LOCUS219 [uncultured virus]
MSPEQISCLQLKSGIIPSTPINPRIVPYDYLKVAATITDPTIIKFLLTQSSPGITPLSWLSSSSSKEFVDVVLQELDVDRFSPEKCWLEGYCSGHLEVIEHLSRKLKPIELTETSATGILRSLHPQMVMRTLTEYNGLSCEDIMIGDHLIWLANQPEARDSQVQLHLVIFFIYHEWEDLLHRVYEILKQNPHCVQNWIGITVIFETHPIMFTQENAKLILKCEERYPTPDYVKTNPIISMGDQIGVIENPDIFEMFLKAFDIPPAFANDLLLAALRSLRPGNVEMIIERYGRTDIAWMTIVEEVIKTGRVGLLQWILRLIPKDRWKDSEQPIQNPPESAVGELMSARLKEYQSLFDTIQKATQGPSPEVVPSLTVSFEEIFVCSLKADSCEIVQYLLSIHPGINWDQLMITIRNSKVNLRIVMLLKDHDYKVNREAADARWKYQISSYGQFIYES